MKKWLVKILVGVLIVVFVLSIQAGVCAIIVEQSGVPVPPSLQAVELLTATVLALVLAAIPGIGVWFSVLAAAAALRRVQQSVPGSAFHNGTRHARISSS